MFMHFASVEIVVIYFCIDTDPCTSVAMCEHICTNTLNGYYCSCNDGYRLVNERSCTGKAYMYYSGAINL